MEYLAARGRTLGGHRMGKRPAMCAPCQPLPAASTPFTCLALRRHTHPATHTHLNFVDFLLAPQLQVVTQHLHLFL